MFTDGHDGAVGVIKIQQEGGRDAVVVRDDPEIAQFARAEQAFRCRVIVEIGHMVPLVGRKPVFVSIRRSRSVIQNERGARKIGHHAV